MTTKEQVVVTLTMSPEAFEIVAGVIDTLAADCRITTRVERIGVPTSSENDWRTLLKSWGEE